MANDISAQLAAALNLGPGDRPFPWQERLLSELARGVVPPVLDIPTGLGKTSVMAIWLLARSTGAKLPRRLVYVVDRRAVVDQATTVAESLRAWVGIDGAVADALGLGGRPLPISTLRGQHVDNREWLEDPSLPAIVVGTVDMVGSRLLFEGYRCSRRMRPYHAALLGADALIVLDEAHLVPAFEAMVRAASDDPLLRPHAAHRNVVPPATVMSLSATGRTAARAFELDDSDRAHEAVRRRLDAKKHVRIGPSVESDALAEALANRAWNLADAGGRSARIIVFVDSRRTAQDIKEALERLAKGDGTTPKREIDAILFVGGRRVAEREASAHKLEELGLLAGSSVPLERPVFVIATSAGEVGVDLDAEHAVLDLVEWERMVQRLGRVNRRGDGEADVWVVPVSLDEKTRAALAKEEKIRTQLMVTDGDVDVGSEEDEGEDELSVEAKPPKKLNEDERSRVERWRRREATLRAFRSLPSLAGAYDASPRAVGELKRAKGDLMEDASTPAPLHPALSRAVVEAWSMTSLEHHTGRPRVRPWLRGWVDEDAQTTVAWRTWLPRQADAKSFFEAAPVETVEALETESALVLDWLLKRVKRCAKVAGEARDAATRTAGDRKPTEEPADSAVPKLALDDIVLYVLDHDIRGWTLSELNGLNKKERDSLLRDMSNEAIVVDARLGGLDSDGLLRADADDASEVGEDQLPFRVRLAERPDDLSSSDGRRVEDTFIVRTNAEGEPTAWLVVETDPKRPSTTADGRSTGHEQSLEEHEAFAERYARGIGTRVGLKPEHVDILALAAVLHDEGKKTERWQRAFGAPKDKRPLAKTTSRPIQTILAGYRHELGSLPYAERDPRVAALSPEDRDLVLHLIASHHGFARPILRTDGCEDAPPSALVERARAIALRFARLEKRWGPWGLAWWETLLRAADQGASRENDERGGARD